MRDVKRCNTQALCAWLLSSLAGVSTLAASGCADSANIDLFPGQGSAADTTDPPSATTPMVSPPPASAPGDPAAPTLSPTVPSVPTVPGTVPAPATPGAPDPADALPPLPLHRYSFAGVGLIVADAISGADGSLVGGASLNGSGSASLDGNDDYVNLPAGLLSSLQDASVMAWVTWMGNNCWHRIFEFGSSVQGNGTVGQAQTELFVTPRNCPGLAEPVGVTGHLRTTSSFQGFIGQIEAPRAVQFQTTLVVDSANAQYVLYVDGSFATALSSAVTLQDINDEVTWLGRSLWVQDFNLPGTYTEFRIYDVALSAAQVSRAMELGPDLLQ